MATLPLLRSFTHLGANLRYLGEFNEFVTNGLETASEPAQTKKFLANLRSTDRRHAAKNQAGSELKMTSR